jgi:GTP-dependent phosphoenolpyruvate carboxykinase
MSRTTPDTYVFPVSWPDWVTENFSKDTIGKMNLLDEQLQINCNHSYGYKNDEYFEKTITYYKISPMKDMQCVKFIVGKRGLRYRAKQDMDDMMEGTEFGCVTFCMDGSIQIDKKEVVHLGDSNYTKQRQLINNKTYEVLSKMMELVLGLKNEQTS